MSILRERFTRALTLLLASALLVVSGGNLLICIEADGRIHLDSGAETCCDNDTPAADAGAMLGAPNRAADDCGSCRDVLAGSAPARQAAPGSFAPPMAQLCLGGESTARSLVLPAADPPSPILASLHTTVIRC